MENRSYAHSQAYTSENEAPTPQQAVRTIPYAITDGSFSNTEQEAIIKQISAERSLLQKKLDEVGITREFLMTHPAVEKALLSGQQTPVVTLELPGNLQLQGRLRIAITEFGPQLRVTPVHQTLLIPSKVGDVQLTQQERQELTEKGFVEQVIHMPEKGGFLAGFLRVDPQTNTVNVWRVNPQTLPSNVLGIDLTRDQQIALACGHPVKLSGLKDQKGELYDATISVNVGQQRIQLSNVSSSGSTVQLEDRFKSQLAHNNQGAKTDRVRGLEEKTGHAIDSNARKEVVAQHTPDNESIPVPSSGKKLRAS